MGSVADPRVFTADPEWVGVPWYAPDCYGQILAVMDDAGLLPDSYVAWHRGAEERVRVLRLAGRTPVPVPVEPEEFVRWCAEQNIRADAEARMEYARMKVARLAQSPPHITVTASEFTARPLTELHFYDILVAPELR